ncbi:MAG: hypothetical protein M3081_12415 [Gemmatimonadota bacterium]|nr:hypothetical protein [Gemmatimonadota bacterium]
MPQPRVLRLTETAVRKMRGHDGKTAMFAAGSRRNRQTEPRTTVLPIGRFSLTERSL